MIWLPENRISRVRFNTRYNIYNTRIWFDWIGLDLVRIFMELYGLDWMWWLWHRF